MSNPGANDFSEYLKKKFKTGRNGCDEKAEYVPRLVLKEYWQANRLKHLLSECDLRENSGQILKHFLCVFSILVYIGNPKAIERFRSYQFDDHNLPLTSRPNDWPKTPDNDELFEKFYKHQWMFCPLEFCHGYMHKRHLEPQMILPVTYKQRLSDKSADGDVAVVYKVGIDGECNKTIPTDVVFKVYQTEQARDLFTTEADAYSIFADEHGEHVAQCFGSFEQNGKRTIILEWAPGGTLLDFFSRTRLPNDRQDLEKLWTALSQLLQGLYFINGMSPKDKPPTWVLSTTHHDIKPDNILVFQHSSNPYEIKFKLADFGTSHIRKELAADAQHVRAATKNGNRMYTAPECSCMYPVQKHVPNQVHSTVDVWALGAVFSETLIWTIWGEDGREKYCCRRQLETSRYEALKGSGYDACFHNGQHRLDAVDAIHVEALANTRKSDTLSEAISDLVLDHMLQTSQKGRLDPMTTFYKFEDKLARLNRLPTDLPSPSSLGSSPRAEIPGSPISSPHHRVISSTSTLSRTSANQQPSFLGGQFTDDPDDFVASPQTLSEALRPDDVPGRRQTFPAPRRPSDFNQAIQPRRDFGEPIIASTVSGPGAATSQQVNAVSIPPDSAIAPVPDLSPAIYGPHRNTSPNQTEIRHTSSSNGSSTDQKVGFKDIHPILTRKNHRTFNIKRMVESRSSRTNLDASSEAMHLPGIQEALSKLQALGPREQLILIDDFASMKRHKHDVQVAARVISYYVKRVDPDKMELYFTSEVKPHQCQTSSALETAINNHEFKTGCCSMRMNLSQILRNIVARPAFRTKAFSIYVFTDAEWEPGPARVDQVIAGAARKLQDEELPSEHIMIQFIRFGDSPVGRERLRHLDDDIVEQFKLGDYDIVDTKSYDDSVPDILIGSISKWIDEKGSSQ
ncbi:kinase-like domain-containing protein [Thelonectria olida]|uniref:Kinase-like domain-containing protein n=1 Tax=Thelonectria olida TaxID=1576542 RepID=A0A9P9AQA4_9HYPO|nr:kinase-like domain-containing protein [Thelonectria olida]